MMTIDQLKYFVMAVDSPTFMEAAERLHVSQATLSKQIRKLETELVIRLFDRSQRQAVLTPAGSAFYRHATILLTDYSNMIHQMKPFHDIDRPTITLGVLPILPQYRLTPLLHNFQKTHPGCRLIINEVEDNILLERLRSKEFDLVIGRSKSLGSLPCKKILLANDELVLLTARNHPLARHRQVSLQELKDESFLFMHQESSIYQLCVQSCENAGFHPNIVRTAKIESILDAVAAGEGVSLLCRKNLDVFNHHNTAVISLSEAITTDVVLAYSTAKKLSAFDQKFIKYISSKG